MQLWEFFVAVKSNFGPLSAAAVFLLAHTYQHIGKARGWPVKIPQWINNMGISAGVLTACFLAWNDQKNAKENAVSDNKYKQERIERLIVAAKPRANPPAVPTFEVKSDHQTGGITAGVVNMEKLGRHLTRTQREEIRNWAVQLLPAGTSLLVNSNQPRGENICR